MTTLRPQAPRQGFTLIEIMLAMAISALVLLAIQGVFFGALRLRNATDRQLADATALQHALDFVATDLRGLMLPGGTLAGQFQTDLSLGFGSLSGGTPVGPTFATSSGRIDATSPFADVQRVSYLLVPSTDKDSTGQTLVRSVDRNLLAYTTDEAEQQPLLDHVLSADFEYYDGTAWTNTWDSSVTASLPTAIRFRVQRTAEISGGTSPSPVEIVVPILVTMPATSTSAS